MPLSPFPLGESQSTPQAGGRRTRKSKGPSVKAIKRTLKKAGLKVSGKKSTLVKRAKKAHLMGGAEGEGEELNEEVVTKVDETKATGGRRHRGPRKH